jgi:polar amino acid transport system substrate-binding protein
MRRALSYCSCACRYPKTDAHFWATCIKSAQFISISDPAGRRLPQPLRLSAVRFDPDARRFGAQRAGVAPACKRVGDRYSRLRYRHPESTSQERIMNSLKLSLAGLLAFILIPIAAFAQALPDLGGKTVVVVTENAYPPLQFVDPKTGKQIGWEYDAMNEIAKRLNFKVEYQNTSWDAMIQAVSDGQYHIGMTGITIKEERKEKVDFSDPYMRSEMFMLVRGDESRFTDAKSFAGFKEGLVGAQAGTTPFYVAVYNVLDGNEQNPRIKLFETFGASVQALKSGDVDVVLTDGTAGKGYVDASNGGLKLVGGPLGTEDFGFIFQKGSDLVAPINAAIAALKADGTIDALNKKWFLDYKMGQ